MGCGGEQPHKGCPVATAARAPFFYFVGFRRDFWFKHNFATFSSLGGTSCCVLLCALFELFPNISSRDLRNFPFYSAHFFVLFFFLPPFAIMLSVSHLNAWQINRQHFAAFPLPFSISISMRFVVLRFLLRFVSLSSHFRLLATLRMINATKRSTEPKKKAAKKNPFNKWHQKLKLAAGA